MKEPCVVTFSQLHLIPSWKVERERGKEEETGWERHSGRSRVVEAEWEGQTGNSLYGS